MSRAALRMRAAASALGGGIITHGSQIDSSNTGPLGAVSTAPFGGAITVNQSWLDANNGGSNILEGYEISEAGFNMGAQVASIPPDTDGIIRFIIQNCRLLGTGWANGGVWTNTALSGSDVPLNFEFRLLHCLIDGEGQVTSAIAETVHQGGQTILRRNEVKNICGMTRNFGDKWQALENYVHSMASVPDDGGASPHTGCITNLHGSHVLIARNKAWTIDPDTGLEGDNIGATGAIVSLARQDEGQGFASSDVQFIDNDLQGGGYSMYCGGSGTFDLTGFVATGNVFQRRLRRLSGQFGPFIALNDNGETDGVWENNTWGALGAGQPGDPAEGTIIEAA